MRSRSLPVALATTLMLAAAMPSSAANGYDGGFVKTVDRTSVAQQSDGIREDLYRVRDHGKRGHGHRGGGRRHVDVDVYVQRPRHGRHYRHGYYLPRYRRPYGHQRHYYQDDYLGAFILGGALGYYLND